MVWWFAFFLTSRPKSRSPNNRLRRTSWSDENALIDSSEEEGDDDDDDEDNDDEDEEIGEGQRHKRG